MRHVDCLDRQSSADTLTGLWQVHDTSAGLCGSGCVVRLQVVDLEPMVAKFGHPSMYLRDNIHPHMFLNIEIFNIYLNILRAHGHFVGPVQTDMSI